MGTQRERRTLTTALELREIDDGAGGKRRVFEGYALKFNKRSEDLGGFDEVLRENCLDGADMSNVVALYNHDASYPLARSTVPSGEGSLQLTVDGIGLRFTLTPTETSYAADLERNMRAGVVNQCSFAFTVADDGQAWTYERDIDTYHREVTKIARLWDVSIVTTPAYPDTEAVASERAFAAAKAADEAARQAAEEREALKRRLAVEVECLVD